MDYVTAFQTELGLEAIGFYSGLLFMSATEY